MLRSVPSSGPAVRPRRPSRGVSAFSALALSALGLVGLAAAVPAHAAALPLTQYVDPFIGTDDSNAPNPVPGGAGGSTYPGAVVPFGGVQVGPDTPTASPSGYRYKDTSVEDFSLTHFDGAGCPNNEDLPLLPVTGALGSSPGTNWTSYASGYTKANEVAKPGYYKTRLDRYATDVELSATTRTAMGKLTYPASTASRLLINTGRSATGNRAGSVHINGNELTGSVTAGGFCGSSKTYQIYFDVRFDRTPTGFGTWSGGSVSDGSATASGTNTGAYVTFDTSTNATVQFKVGLSYVSIAGAQANVAAENAGWDFGAIRTAADTAWNQMLNRLQVTGGSATERQKFYTALYHVLQSPNISSDVNGDYRGFDSAVHNASRPVYQNYSGWDIYRSWASLIALMAPTEASDIAKSMVLDGQQGGLLPKWSQQTNEDFVMTGDPGPIIVSSLYAFGARDFDTSAALSLMEKASNGGTAQGSAIRGRQSTYTSLHYLDDPSDSLEYSASDFAVAQFAKALGNTSSYNTHMGRAQWWRNTFNSESSYVQQHQSDGSWSWPLDPASQSTFTEGNASQYTWMVPYDFSDLINSMGGAGTAVQRLDHHFTEVNAGQSRPYYYIGNEPEHGVPWAYNYARHPAGATDAVRKVMDESFTTGAGGLPGNDDLGATSAWYVWAALGMYPATPGADTLAVHGPQFPSILIQRAAGNITINSSGSGPYVQALAVNGTSTSHSYLRYPDVAGGATLNYTMGAAPSGTWGTGASDVPPSFQDGATPVPAAPELGTDLALGKPVTGSASCAAAESADKAVDGSLTNNSKWCSSAANPSLQVDLGSVRNVSSFVIKHAGLGGENTGWNTGAFQIQTSTDGTAWTAAATVTGSRSSRTYHPVSARSARYVRLVVTSPSNTSGGGSDAARVYELEVYGPSGGSRDLAIGQPATGSASCNATETPEKAVNGSFTGGTGDKWCSKASGTKTLQVDLGASHPLSSITVRHAGAGGESADWNTKDYDLSVSGDGATWTTAAQVRGNTADSTTSTVTGSARYVRLGVLVPAQNTDPAARIYELEVNGS
ncbi:alpha-1,2-mannosidase [Streptomyces xanthochromogenes]|uniref:GH92 family glycosyl hydrolase n=1 Tax=Streptomyces xanthochromogenes TaxID=67384 RepID=UPI00198E4096|nr:GH92 family glycosyl hydrolase [Streptomyces xanthochromogenes]GHB34015.1 alpha-1,2-mannosidase [Streptomyces xanthochromogenes]